MTLPDSAALIDRYQTRIEQQLQQHLNHPPEVATLNRAMRYSALNAGKRLRPMLVYATAETLSTPLNKVDAAACAVELIHCYSLIHDDLPAMDDDDLRRGQPSCHRAFDEATAILAGDAIQSLAFEILTAPTAHLDSQQQLAMCHQLAQSCGINGMAGGQAMDLEATGKSLEQAALATMHQRKTGALLSACVKLACVASTTSDAQSQVLDTLAEQFGLAFQIQDDILDIESSSDTLGKPQHSDSQQGKATYPSILGLDTAKQACMQHFAQVNTILQQLFPNSPLQQLIKFTETRSC